MKIGCHAAALQKVRKAPYHEAIENAGKLGFEGLELIAMDLAELNDYYTDERCAALRAQAENNDLVISQFALYSTACEGMASLDPSEKEQGLKAFFRAADVCGKLGCGIVNLVAHWPVGLTCPHPYPPSYIHPIGRGMMSTPSPKMVMKIPQPFDADAIWENYVDSLAQVTRYCEEKGIKFALEGHAHVIVSGTDAMLRLFDRIPSKALVINFDTSWHFIQREYLPMSVYKLKDRIGHVHLRDSDGLLFYGAPVGQGIIDMRGLIQTLREVGYDGFLSFEYSGFEDYLGVAGQSKDYIERILEEHTIAP
ncbi:sugar phosphate isomerase/epimerase family protein [Microvirga pudoricolor]|uniref:sugar phosphate isomerase/epimerase family protein n=1 Tax=Microvirga pudoricolor TaxID=2778729 RepID=UPI00194E3B5D|nr:sugar phosphate isomerase/epimerase family protein [Microvirga pudoricolor]MBM6596289.1 sugar phosphate isomerase/epimerase [Microvirga pudoricolor]